MELTNKSLVEAILEREAQESRENPDIYEVARVLCESGRTMIMVADRSFKYEL